MIEDRGPVMRFDPHETLSEYIAMGGIKDGNGLLTEVGLVAGALLNKNR